MGVSDQFSSFQLLSHVRLFVTPWTVANQAPRSMKFSRQEYWSRLPFPSPRDLPNPGIEPSLPHCRQTLYHLSHQGSWKESWVPKNWGFWIVVLKTLDSPLDCKEIQPVHPKGNQSWTFIGRTDAEAETLILWPPDVKNWLTGKDLDAGNDWKQQKTSEDIRYLNQLNGHEFEQTLGDSEG